MWLPASPEPGVSNSARMSQNEDDTCLREVLLDPFKEETDSNVFYQSLAA